VNLGLSVSWLEFVDGKIGFSAALSGDDVQYIGKFTYEVEMTGPSNYIESLLGNEIEINVATDGPNFIIDPANLQCTKGNSPVTNYQVTVKVTDPNQCVPMSSSLSQSCKKILIYSYQTHFEGYL